jgi:hypothetical protein
VIVAVSADDSGTAAPVPDGRVRRIPQPPTGRESGLAHGLGEAALAHARRAAAEAPPLPSGAVERLRQIIYGACDSAAPAERKAG